MADEVRAGTSTQQGRVRIEEGVVFGTGGGRELRCDIFHPPSARSDGKSVLLLHGGAWYQGDRAQLRGYGIALGRLGYVCVAAEYRLTGESKWPAQIHDAKACLRYMRARSDELGLDPDKIVAWGNSAGGHLALLLAGTPGVLELEGEGGNPEQPTRVEACVAFYPPVVCGPEQRSDGNIPALFPPDASDEVLSQASPITHARADFPPTLLMHGNADKIVSVRHSLDMHDALRRARARVELHVFSDAPHGFDAGRTLGRPAVQLAHLFLERSTGSEQRDA